MPRAFLAITPPIAVRSTLMSCRDAFLAEDPAWRSEKWVAEENLHVTLRFLGTISEADYPRIVESVRSGLEGFETYRMRLDTVRAIPRPRSASLVWAGPSAGREETLHLAGRMAAATSFVDFEPQGRGFRTHVTLCRARHPRRVSSHAIDAMEHILRMSEERAVSMSVREVTLFSSTLTPRGPVYEEIAIIPFGE